MAKKSLMALVLAIFVAGWSFAQVELAEHAEPVDQAEQTESMEQEESAELAELAEQEEQADQAEPTAFDEMAKNTITVDIGPTITGILIHTIGDMINKDAGGEYASSSGFGIGAQYERQLMEKLSVAGRFAYMRGGLAAVVDVDDFSLDAELTVSSFSLEGHVRYYPMGEVFFLDGMLGYADLSVGINGKATSGADSDIISLTLSRDYFKIGAKAGWRMSFGEKGGFTFESAIGYYWGFGFGDTVGKKLADSFENIKDAPVDQIDGPFKKYIEDLVFIGGPRLTLALGWRF